MPKAASVCPPEDQGGQGDPSGQAIADPKPAAFGHVVRLKKRSEFLAVAATGRRWVAPSFVLQVGPRPMGGIGLGFTATKRIGNAVARNRAKRRLRAAASHLLPEAATIDHDYVLIARSGVLTCAFQTLLDDLEKAFSRVLTAKPRSPLPKRATKRSGTAAKTDTASSPSPSGC